MRTILAGSLGAAVVLIAAVTVRGQTGAAMLMQPLVSDEELVEFRADSIFLNQAHSDSPGSPGVKLNIYEASGRVREQREKWLPRLGLDVLYLDIHGDDPRIPRRLVDSSFTFALGAENLNGWTLGMSLGAGYAGTEPL